MATNVNGLLCLIIMNCVDAVMTQFAFQDGVPEWNPLLKALMDWDYSTYLFYKLGFVPFLIIVFFALSGRKRWIAVSFGLTVIFFIFLCGYHVYNLV